MRINTTNADNLQLDEVVTWQRNQQGSGHPTKDREGKNGFHNSESCVKILSDVQKDETTYV